MRRLLPLLLACATAPAAEVARRDLLVAVNTGDGGYAYDLSTAIGDFSGDDAFDRLDVLRLGGRWAWAKAGSALAPLAGIDVEVTDAPQAGGGLRAYGLGLAAGGTWAISDRWAFDGEGFAGWHRANLDLASTGGTVLSGSGDLQRLGLRTRLLWHPAPRWSVGLEAGYSLWSADLAADAGRSLRLTGDGACIGLVLCWRPSARPGGVE